MDVVPEGGVRDHLVVTSRWPGERQLGDSSSSSWHEPTYSKIGTSASAHCSLGKLPL
jgi:hypothetical protein